MVREIEIDDIDISYYEEDNFTFKDRLNNNKLGLVIVIILIIELIALIILGLSESFIGKSGYAFYSVMFIFMIPFLLLFIVATAIGTFKLLILLSDFKKIRGKLGALAIYFIWTPALIYVTYFVSVSSFHLIQDIPYLDNPKEIIITEYDLKYIDSREMDQYYLSFKDQDNNQYEVRIPSSEYAIIQSENLNIKKVYMYPNSNILASYKVE